MAKLKPAKVRIVEHGDVDPRTLLANPKNTALHGAQQMAAAEGVLEDVGFVAPVIVNKTTGRLLDGHMRVAVALRAGYATVPVDYVELSEAEEAKILLSFNEIGRMSARRQDTMLELLAHVESDNADFEAFAAELQRELEIELNAERRERHEKADAEALAEEKLDKAGPPEMELQPYESYDYIVVLARTTFDWNILCEKLGIERVDAQTVRHGHRKIGLGRAISADRLLALMKD
jgi:hypothetical protein